MPTKISITDRAPRISIRILIHFIWKNWGCCKFCSSSFDHARNSLSRIADKADATLAKTNVLAHSTQIPLQAASFSSLFRFCKPFLFETRKLLECAETLLQFITHNKECAAINLRFVLWRNKECKKLLKEGEEVLKTRRLRMWMSSCEAFWSAVLLANREN